jgi:hypothetical protein
MLGVVLRQAWQRSGGKCECTSLNHDHPYIRCNKPLVWDRQDKPLPGGWRVHYRLGYSRNAIAACKILCWDCY